MTGKYLRLNRPQGILTQAFGKNANVSYKQSGLEGHTGEDYVLGWKKPIKAVVDGEVYSTLNLKSTDTDRYRAIYQIVDLEEASYEVSYGHIDASLVSIGDMVHAGQIIATEGNFGLCYSGGKKVTPAQKKTGKGSHLHFQVRKCTRVKTRERGRTYLRNSKGYLKRNGFYYEVVDYDKGYSGCVNPSMFYEIGLGVVLRILRLFGLIK
jgi:murein DD-endopeptidase MepM/ murein hydrolase activator NlpD